MDPNLVPNQQQIAKKKPRLSVIMGAVFLMATSAIGPGFLTQTTVFTEQFVSNFAFAILASVVIDIGIQLNVWRVISISGMLGQDVANTVCKGLGSVIAILIVIGGLAFNIGNVAGAAMGMNVMFGMDLATGAIISSLIAVGVFVVKEAGKAMDRIAQTLGVVMLLMVLYTMMTTHPPVAEAAVKSLFPDDYGALMFPTITLIGGTVGGYITFAGAHRLLDAGITGKESLKDINRSASTGILVTGVMRVGLFLAALGIVYAGNKLDPANPPASVFQYALGDVGYKVFGIILWSAALTSVIGAAYTSVSFLRSFHENIKKYNNYVIIAFIIFSTLVFVLIGRPVTILVIVGSLNGLILPLSLGAILLASRNKKVVGTDYNHPVWMTVMGILALVITTVAGVMSLEAIAKMWG